MEGIKSEFAPSFVRDQLDEILAHEITSLIDVDSDVAKMSYNLATLSCITVIVDREKEIRQYTEFPPERYTLESFFNELVDIGLEKDVTLENAVQSVIKSGYVSRDDAGELKAEMSAYTMMGFLDNMFPGMQGMNLIAFVLQMNDEVNSNRKTLEEAKESFAQTLKSRGVIVTKDIAEKKGSDIASGIIKPHTQSREISRKLKQDNLNRLSQIMKKRKSRTHETTGKFKIKDIFDKGSTKEEIEAQKAEIRKAEEDAKRVAQLAIELAQKDEEIKEALEAAEEAARQLKEFEKSEQELTAARKEAERAREMTTRLEEKEAQIAQREARLKEMEERLKKEEEDLRKIDEAAKQKALEAEMKKTSRADDDIESRIAAFESELTMPCPMCKDGEIISKKTEKGKDFFSCTRDDCRFVSWDKPYHFECPLCKNSFLTEMAAPNGDKGLKCPRASCSFTQNNLLDPVVNMARTASESSPKKKKKVVRRVKRR